MLQEYTAFSVHSGDPYELKPDEQFTHLHWYWKTLLPDDPRDFAYGKFMSLMSQQLENVDTLPLNGMQDASLQQSSVL